jgi:hypothetical protein
MSAIKEFYHDEICSGIKEMQKAEDLDSQYQEMKEQDAQIIARVEEIEHSEMPNFLR